MAILVQITKLHHTMGGKELFSGIDLAINEGDRIGLVGHNGSGKSTLLSLLAGEAQPDQGEVQWRRGLRVKAVEQFLPEPLVGKSSVEAVGSERWRAESILSALGFTEAALEFTVGDLSGGQQNRLMFARALVDEPDLLLLDEPTNHLDLATIVKFEEQLVRVRSTFVLVSHDRAFLDTVTARTLVVRDRRTYSFTGGYTQAQQNLLHMDEAAARNRAAEERKIEAVRASAKRLSIWGKVYDNEKFARRAKSMELRVERMEQQRTFVTRGSPLTLSVEAGGNRARETVRIEDLDVTVAGTVLFHIEQLLIRPGERVALLGHNGVGKSTFIRSLVGCEPDRDTAGIRLGPQTRLGYYDQELDEVKGSDTMLRFVAERVTLAEEQLRRRLINTGFPYPDHGKRIDMLSGGERARLLFLVLSINRPNFLILDEPTNHIDIEGKEQLEDQLVDGGAALLITSHDRRFIETVADRFVWIQGGRLQELTDPSEFFVSAEAATETRKSTPVDDANLLDRIVDLEGKLKADRARKPKFQKPLRQSEWKQELETLYSKL